jgi:hypothetical protein
MHYSFPLTMYFFAWTYHCIEVDSCIAT